MPEIMNFESISNLCDEVSNITILKEHQRIGVHRIVNTFLRNSSDYDYTNNSLEDNRDIRLLKEKYLPIVHQAMKLLPKDDDTEEQQILSQLMTEKDAQIYNHQYTLQNATNIINTYPFHSLFLSDEMGLGKTLTALTSIMICKKMIPNFPNKNMPFLIIGKKNILNVWEQQIREHFLPHTIENEEEDAEHIIIRYEGTKKQRQKKMQQILENMQNILCVIISIDLLKRSDADKEEIRSSLHNRSLLLDRISQEPIIEKSKKRPRNDDIDDDIGDVNDIEDGYVESKQNDNVDNNDNVAMNEEINIQVDTYLHDIISDSKVANLYVTGRIYKSDDTERFSIQFNNSFLIEGDNNIIMYYYNNSDNQEAIQEFCNDNNMSLNDFTPDLEKVLSYVNSYLKKSNKRSLPDDPDDVASSNASPNVASSNNKRQKLTHNELTAGSNDNIDDFLNLLQIPFSAIYIDEIHFAKTGNVEENKKESKIFKMLYKFCNNYPQTPKLGISGTLISNSIFDFANLCKIVFSENKLMNANDFWRNQSVLSQLIPSIREYCILRRTFRSLNIYLPEKHEYNVTFDLSPMEFEKYSEGLTFANIAFFEYQSIKNKPDSTPFQVGNARKRFHAKLQVLRFIVNHSEIFPLHLSKETNTKVSKVMKDMNISDFHMFSNSASFNQNYENSVLISNNLSILYSDDNTQIVQIYLGNELPLSQVDTQKNEVKQYLSTLPQKQYTILLNTSQQLKQALLQEENIIEFKKESNAFSNLTSEVGVFQLFTMTGLNIGNLKPLSIAGKHFVYVHQANQIVNSIFDIEAISSKEHKILEIVHNYQNHEWPLIIVSKSEMFLEHIKYLLANDQVLQRYNINRKFQIASLTGKTKPKDRKHIMDQLIISSEQCNIDILCMTLDTGKEGITLTKSNVMISCDSSSEANVQNENQLFARIHRLGQTKECNFFRLIGNRTIDDAIYNTIHKYKNRLFDCIMDSEGNEKLSDIQYESLLGSLNNLVNT